MTASMSPVRSVLSALALCTVLASPSLAADGAEAPFAAQPGELLAAAARAEERLQPTQSAILLFEQLELSFDETLRARSSYRLVYKVLDPSALPDLGAVAAAWSPWNEERPVVRARVITADGVAHTMETDALAEYPSGQAGPSTYEDVRSLRAPLPAVATGAVVEYEVIRTEREPYFEAGRVHRFWFGSGYAVARQRFAVEVPAAVSVRHQVRGELDVQPQRSEADGRVRLVFEASDRAAVEEIEPFAPSDVVQVPCVDLAVGGTWEQVASAYAGIVEAQLRHADLRDPVREVTKGTKGRGEAIAALVQRLHRDVRYTGVEFGEAALVPRAPAEVLRRGYGDCKDKAVLLVAMLRAAGIPAHVVLLADDGGGEIDVHPSLPGLGLFDHAIVVVPGDQEVWIDPTEDLLPAGELPTRDQGRLALVARPGTKELIRTPEAPSTASRHVESRQVVLPELGRARIVESTEATGMKAHALRSMCAGGTADDLRQRMELYATGVLGARSVGEVQCIDTREPAKPLRMRIEAVDAEIAESYTDGAVLAVSPMGLVVDLGTTLAGASGPEEDADGREGAAKKRRFDLVLPVTYVLEHRYHVVLPPGFAAGPLPESRQDEIGPALLRRSYGVEEDGSLTISFLLDTGKRRWSPEEVEAARSRLEELAGEDTQAIVIPQVGEQHLTEGRLREALAEFRRLAALHPTEALHVAQSARALLASGLGEAARLEARRATALEPESLHAHSSLGWVLLHDLVGRPFAKGWDPAGAEAAYRRAKEIDPKDIEVRTLLAWLLEHDEKGRWLAPRARIEEAVTEYRAIRDELEDHSVDLPLLRALVVARKFDEARELALAMPQEADRDRFLLTALVLTRDAQAAVREAAHLLPGADVRRAAMGAASETLTGLRRYEEAAALARQSLKGLAADQAVVQRGRIALLESFRRHEDLAIAESDPMFPVVAFARALFLGAPDEQIAQQFTRAARGAIPASFFDESAAGREYGEDATDPDTLVDVYLSGTEHRVEGDDALGYRVRLVPRGNPQAASTFFVTREDGAYRLAAKDSMPHLLGIEILRRLDAGDTAAARAWLDWAVEMMPVPSSADPLAQAPVLTLWRGRDSADAQIRPAALALAGAGGVGPWLEQLRSMREQAPEGAVRTALTLSLAVGALAEERLEEVEALGRELLRTHPTSDAAFGLVGEALERQRKWAALAELGDERLSRSPGDILGMRARARSAAELGQGELAETWYRKVVASPRAEGRDYNNFAWSFALAQRASEEAVDLARRSIERDDEPGPNLHTLATLLAELGHVGEAREAILAGLEAGDHEEPTPEHWYVFGRIAEQMGEHDAAVAAYGRVRAERQDDDEPACAPMARRRLAAIRSGGAGARPADPAPSPSTAGGATPRG